MRSRSHSIFFLLLILYSNVFRFYVRIEFLLCSSAFVTCPCFLSARRTLFFPPHQCSSFEMGHWFIETKRRKSKRERGREKRKSAFHIQENVTFRAYSYISSALCRVAMFTMRLFSRGSICLIANE